MMKENRNSITYRVDVLIRWRRIIYKIFLITCAVAVVISLLIPPKYTASASIMPPNPEQETMLGLIGMNISSTLSKLSQLSGIPGMSTPSDLYAAIMKSDRVKGEIINKFNLKKEFKSKTFTDASKMLEKITKISVSPVGIITVSVTYKNKYLAAQIANAYIEELDRFNKETVMTTGRKYRIFVEERLKMTTDSLQKAEESLRKFQEKHRTVALDIEIENAIEIIAKLKSEIILREVQKGAVASTGSINNPFVANIDKELRELKRQLAKIEFGTTDTTLKEFGAGFSVPFGKLPELSLEYARLLREVKIQEAVYELLTQQYEQAKIMEAKETPTVQIIDRASPPEKKSGPKRSKIVILSALFSLFFGVCLAFLLDWYENLKTDKDKVAKFNEIYLKLKADLNAIKTNIIKIFNPSKDKN